MHIKSEGSLIEQLKWNQTLNGLPVYEPGRPMEEVARDLGLSLNNLVKLASNENPLGPSPKAVEAIKEHLSNIHLYPDGNAYYLKQRLGEKFNIDPSYFIVGNGSNELIELVSHALIGPGKEVIVSEFCFAVYPIVTLMAGGILRTVPAYNFGHDLLAMLRSINENTTVIFVANPNNPTGTIAPAEDLLRLVENIPDHVLLVVDEAYIDYLENPVDLLPYIRGGKHNLLLLRTFSKIYGLAGLRIGYGIGHPALINRLNKVREPFNTNRLAQVAALAALDDYEHVERSRAINKNGLEYFYRQFRELGLDFVPSVANFILVKVGDGRRVFNLMQEKGVIIRPMDGYKLKEWIRVTVGTFEQNKRCIDTLKEVLSL